MPRRRIAIDEALDKHRITCPRCGGPEAVVLLNEKLVIITPNGANVDNPVTLEPLGGGRFRYTAPTGGGVAPADFSSASTFGSPGVPRTCMACSPIFTTWMG